MNTGLPCPCSRKLILQTILFSKSMMWRARPLSFAFSLENLGSNVRKRLCVSGLPLSGSYRGSACAYIFLFIFSATSMFARCDLCSDICIVKASWGRPVIFPACCCRRRLEKLDQSCDVRSWCDIRSCRHHLHYPNLEYLSTAPAELKEGIRSGVWGEYSYVYTASGDVTIEAHIIKWERRWSVKYSRAVSALRARLWHTRRSIPWTAGDIWL